jgi:hypothetical protein
MESSVVMGSERSDSGGGDSSDPLNEQMFLQKAWLDMAELDRRLAGLGMGTTKVKSFP